MEVYSCPARGRTPRGQERRHRGLAMGQGAPAAAWGRDSGSLWNVDSRELGTPPSLSAPNPVCVPSSTELTGPPLAGTHHHHSPSHPRQCTVGTEQRAMSVGVTPAHQHPEHRADFMALQVQGWPRSPGDRTRTPKRCFLPPVTAQAGQLLDARGWGTRPPGCTP